MKCVAAIQMVSGLSVEANLTQAAQLIAQAVSQGAKLVVLPEYFAVLDSTQLVAVGKKEIYANGQIRSFLSQQAKKNKVWIVAGTLPTVTSIDDQVNADNKIYAACFVYDDKGTEVARYDKIHLFDVTVDDNQSTYNESKTTQAGDRVVTIDTPVGKVGLAVCYDVRFPELFRQLRAQGADIFVLPSAFTEVTGKAHWEVLIRARAVENFCYVIAAGQGGVHENHRSTFGHSMVVDSWGNVINRLAKGAGVVIADIDLEKQADIRKKMPVHEHQRLLPTTLN
jgi:nitrilase